MSRIHNTMLLRGLSIAVAFSVFFNVLALTNEINIIEWLSNVAVPLIFLFMVNYSNQRSTHWLIFPLTIYLIDRFFVYMWMGIDGLTEGLRTVYQNDTLEFFFQINSVRLVLTLVFVILLISAITSKQKEWFYKLHMFSVVLFVIQIIEIGLWIFTGLYRLSPSVIAQILVVPSLIYFPLIMMFVTRLHVYEVFVGHHSLHNTPAKSGPDESGTLPPNPTVTHKQATPPETPIKSSYQTKTNSPKSPPNKNHASPSQVAPIKCPLCGTENTNATICSNCGQSLK